MSYSNVRHDKDDQVFRLALKLRAVWVACWTFTENFFKLTLKAPESMRREPEAGKRKSEVGEAEGVTPAAAVAGGASGGQFHGA